MCSCGTSAAQARAAASSDCVGRRHHAHSSSFARISPQQPVGAPQRRRPPSRHNHTTKYRPTCSASRVSEHLRGDVCHGVEEAVAVAPAHPPKHARSSRAQLAARAGECRPCPGAADLQDRPLPRPATLESVITYPAAEPARHGPRIPSRTPVTTPQAPPTLKPSTAPGCRHLSDPRPRPCPPLCILAAPAPLLGSQL